MLRRRFLAAMAAGAAAPVIGGGCASRSSRVPAGAFDFEPFRASPTLAPVTRVTPDDGFYVHTYYDVCPFSPSGRYLAVTRLPYQTRIPVLGDTADVCVIDLRDRILRTLYTTKSWGFQTGSLAQWGATDRHLYTNDVVRGRAACVRLDLETGERRAFEGPMYHIAPDESAVIGFPLELLDVTQRGYGVTPRDPDHPPRLPAGASATEGIWKTDLRTGRKELLVSLADMAARVPEPPPEPGGTFYHRGVDQPGHETVGTNALPDEFQGQGF